MAFIRRTACQRASGSTATARSCNAPVLSRGLDPTVMGHSPRGPRRAALAMAAVAWPALLVVPGRIRTCSVQVCTARTSSPSSGHKQNAECLVSLDMRSRLEECAAGDDVQRPVKVVEVGEGCCNLILLHPHPLRNGHHHALPRITRHQPTSAKVSIIANL